ncbi:MAG TPA: chitobiase/beta-hexosaminidase C-terminal domain-containing protein [Candidatus Ventricola gallistercoris]|nr:chitobiase/beta-hexosaminidase C-terminal domain-containing protein [Candidatus Ventricola gallistercoris]
MICPNCGRELPDTARVCPSCNAVQRVARRRRAEADVPDAQQRVRVSRRVMPQQEEAMHEREQTGEQNTGTVSTPNRSRREEPHRTAPSAGHVPAGLTKQAARSRVQVRHVRHAPDNIRRKVDASPVLLAPPIYQKSHKRLLRVVFLILLMALFVFSAGGYMLLRTEDGQQLMAQWGWSLARTDAYVTLGKELYDQAYYTRALEALDVAIEREPQNVDALIIMAQAYTELGRVEEAKAIYESLINEIAPAHPSAYRNLIKIYQQEGYNAEALALMRQASENATSTQEFEVMLREYTPEAPKISHTGGRYTDEIDVTIEIPEGETVYYTTDGTDPSESGMVYTEGTVIHVEEGKLTVKAIAFTENGTPSEQIEEDYTVIIPTPAAPKANYASGKYKYAPKVSLRAGEEKDDGNKSPIVAIYYTLDGRQATTESTLYNPDEPIQLPIGKSTLRAIAVAANGKISYEMTVTYEVEGNLKKMFASSDTFKNMELYKTGYNTFTKAWGTPETYELLPEEQWYDPEMESYEAVYSWGTARFVIKTEGGSPVLYALDTTSTEMTAPRSTKVGMEGAEVMDKFRDLGQAALDDDGNRLLYNWNSANVQFGTYRLESDGRYALHYYYPVDDNNTIFVELSYYLDEEGNVERVVWQRYQSVV